MPMIDELDILCRAPPARESAQLPVLAAARGVVLSAERLRRSSDRMTPGPTGRDPRLPGATAGRTRGFGGADDDGRDSTPPAFCSSGALFIGQQARHAFVPRERES